MPNVTGVFGKALTPHRALPRHWWRICRSNTPGILWCVRTKPTVPKFSALLCWNVSHNTGNMNVCSTSSTSPHLFAAILDLYFSCGSVSSCRWLTWRSQRSSGTAPCGARCEAHIQPRPYHGENQPDWVVMSRCTVGFVAYSRHIDALADDGWRDVSCVLWRTYPYCTVPDSGAERLRYTVLWRNNCWQQGRNVRHFLESAPNRPVGFVFVFKRIEPHRTFFRKIIRKIFRKSPYRTAP